MIKIWNIYSQALLHEYLLENTRDLVWNFSNFILIVIFYFLEYKKTCIENSQKGIPDEVGSTTKYINFLSQWFAQKKMSFFKSHPDLSFSLTFL